MVLMCKNCESKFDIDVGNKTKEKTDNCIEVDFEWRCPVCGNWTYLEMFYPTEQ